MKRSLFLLCALFLAGCSSLPTELESNQENTIVTYTPFSDASESGSAVAVRLGGVIARIDNQAEKTRIEVVNLPISSAGKPDISEEPNGRFVVYMDGFVDPIAYAKGRLITVLGKTAPIEKGNVGDYEYSFPVIDGSALHLWQIQEYVVTNDFDMDYMPCRGTRCMYQRSHIDTRRGKVVQEVQ